MHLPFHTCSGYKGLTPSYENFVNLVNVIFCGQGYSAKFDPALYLNLYAISREVDIGELQLTLGLSHLVQQEVLSSLTQSYGTYKVGRIDEVALTKAIKSLQSNRSGNIEGVATLMDEATTEDSADGDSKLLDIIIPLVEHVRIHQKKRWCSIDVIELANKLNCKPSMILLCAGDLLAHHRHRHHILNNHCH